MIQAIRGTKDILPDRIAEWHFAEDIFRKVSANFAFTELRTPIFEKTEVFSRSIGESTDIVNKEMYTFTDRGGESITLRPEMTAALVRSVIQNNLLAQSQLLKLWYVGPFFRYERPQKGRLRQFHQYGAECLGSSYPESDAEIILLAVSIIKNLGIENYKLLINSLGNESSRISFRNHLVEYLNKYRNSLSQDSQFRLDNNPLRVLDSKDEKDIEIISSAPDILDFLDTESKLYFETVCDMLIQCGIEYQVQPRLVRGLDYYSHTVFEFQSSSLGAQDSFGGGGRYDGLFAQLGGKSSGAVGFAMGIERLLLILENENLVIPNAEVTDIFVILADNNLIHEALKISENLRNLGYKVQNDLQRRSLKSQMRDANKSMAKYALILGEEEYNKGEIIIKNMSDSSQLIVSIDKITEYQFNIDR